MNKSTDLKEGVLSFTSDCTWAPRHTHWSMYDLRHTHWSVVSPWLCSCDGWALSKCVCMCIQWDSHSSWNSDAEEGCTEPHWDQYRGRGSVLSLSLHCTGELSHTLSQNRTHWPRVICNVPKSYPLSESYKLYWVSSITEDAFLSKINSTVALCTKCA